MPRIFEGPHSPRNRGPGIAGIQAIGAAVLMANGMYAAIIVDAPMPLPNARKPLPSLTSSCSMIGPGSTRPRRWWSNEAFASGSTL